MIYNLHILRILAALAVVYVHVCSGAGLGLNIGAGNFGVDVFFVISGFTISYVGQMSAGKFLLRRLIRIVPFYWAATIGTYAIALLDPSKVQSSSADITHLLCSLFFIPHANKVGNLDPILALGWSLNYEMYFYFLFALTLLVSIRWAPVLCSGLMLIIAVSLHLSGTQSPQLLFYAKPIVFEFVLGVGVFYLVQSQRVRRWVTLQGTPLKLGLLGCVGLAAVGLPFQEITWHGERALQAGPLAFLFVLSSILLERCYALAFKGKLTVLLGDASYVLYLTHPYVVYGFIRLCLNPSTLGPVETGAAIVGLLALATVVAAGVHIVFERPVLALLRNLTSSKGRTAGPSAPVLDANSTQSS